jgi:hypothetical protein
MMPEATRAAIAEKFGTTEDHIYIKTDPGIVAILAEDQEGCQYIVDQVRKLVSLGHVTEIVICGHQDCKANIVSDDEQMDQIRKSVKILTETFEGISCFGVFFEEDKSEEYGWNRSGYRVVDCHFS